MSSKAASRSQKRPQRKDTKNSGSRPFPRLNWTLVSLTTGFLALVAAWWFQLLSSETALETPLNFFRSIEEDGYWEGCREEVKDAFVTSWDAYARYAWGKFVHPMPHHRLR